MAVASAGATARVVATVMHGAANIATPILLPGVDRAWWLVVTGAVYAAVAVGIALAERRQAVRLATAGLATSS